MPALPQRAFCEWLGTAFLLAAVVGSGIMAQKLAGDGALALLCNTRAATSLHFMYLQLGFIHAVCIYCLISAVTTFLLLFTALWHFLATRLPTIKN